MLTQALTVDASTRRRGTRLDEVTWDDRLARRVLRPDGTEIRLPTPHSGMDGDDDDVLLRLEPLESVVLALEVPLPSTNWRWLEPQDLSWTKAYGQLFVFVDLVLPMCVVSGRVRELRVMARGMMTTKKMMLSCGLALKLEPGTRARLRPLWYAYPVPPHACP